MPDRFTDWIICRVQDAAFLVCMFALMAVLTLLITGGGTR